MGFQPTASSTAEAALREAQSQGFDILILDLNLPGMSGLDMLERLRQSQPDVQVIVLTGFGDLQAAKHAIRLDVVDFLTKPCALGTLEEALDRRVAEDTRRSSPSRPCPSRQVLRPLLPRTPAIGSRWKNSNMAYILAVLEKNNGNRTATAAELGISVASFTIALGSIRNRGCYRK